MRHKWNLFLELMRWAEGGSCRHDAILRYFGDEEETRNWMIALTWARPRIRIVCAAAACVGPQNPRTEDVACQAPSLHPAQT